MRTKTKFHIAAAVLAINIFGVASCKSPTESSESSIVVVNIAPIYGVTVPVPGATPVTRITENEQYSGTVAWYPPVYNNTFEAETQYTATINLTAKPGYTLQGVRENFFTVDGAWRVSNAPNSRVVIAVFNPAVNKINTAAITGVITPVTGGIAVSSLTENEQYYGYVTWSPATWIFEANTEYTANIILTAKYGYTFQGVPANFFTVEGAVATNIANSDFVTAVFPATAPADPSDPTTADFNISGVGTFTYDGSPKTVTITPKPGKSTGKITVKYNDSTNAHSAIGDYIVYFDVAAATGFNAATGLFAGNISIIKAAGAAVSTPTINTKNRYYITINAAAAPGTGQTIEYAINTEDTAPLTGWQTDTTFNGLNAGTTYYIFARAAGNSIYETGAVSAPSLIVTTPQTTSPDWIEYYWVDQLHGRLVTTSGGATAVVVGGTLTITAQGTGYVVERWYLNGINTGQNGNTYNFSSTVTGNHTVDLFLQKDGKLYNTSITIIVGIPVVVTFHANSGNGTAPEPQTVPLGSSTSLPGGSGLYRNGYTFSGWNTNSSGTGDNYNTNYTPTGNITLYARWVANVIVNFNINGGTGTVPAQRTVPAGTTISLSGSSMFYRNGYNFGGWNTRADGTGDNYDIYDNYTPTSSITFYAKWNAWL
jgi:uncharacterized repeat protein (TIGR02543 family)